MEQTCCSGQLVNLNVGKNAGKWLPREMASDEVHFNKRRCFYEVTKITTGIVDIGLYWLIEKQQWYLDCRLINALPRSTHLVLFPPFYLTSRLHNCCGQRPKKLIAKGTKNHNLD